jgi:hypothetical protein
LKTPFDRTPLHADDNARKFWGRTNQRQKAQEDDRMNEIVLSERTSPSNPRRYALGNLGSFKHLRKEGRFGTDESFLLISRIPLEFEAWFDWKSNGILGGRNTVLGNDRG